MALDVVSRNKLMGYIKKRSISELEYYEFYDEMSTKKKVYDNEVLAYLIETIYSILTGNKEMSSNMLEKFFHSCFIFLGPCLLTNQNIDSGLIIKMWAFKDDYIKLCNDNNYEVSENIIGVIDNIEVLLKTKYKKEENAQASIFALKVKELENEIKRLKDLVIQKDSDYETLEKTLKVLQNEMNLKTVEFKKLQKEYDDRKKDFGLFDEIKRSLENTNANLVGVKTELKELQEQNNTLASKNEELIEKINEQKEFILNVDKEKEKLAKQDFLDNLILSTLLKETMYFNKLVLKLKSLGHVFEEQEVFESLIRIGKKFNITDNQTIIIPQQYGIFEPEVNTNKTLILNSSPNSCMDIMFLSDLHVDEVNNKVIKAMNNVYDYCAKYNISTIINLGDFLDSNDSLIFNRDKNNLDKIMILMEEIIKKFPSSPSVTHAILGGNHDKDYLAYGIDPIKYISTARRDLIDLGYDDAFLEFTKLADSHKDFIGLHHKGLPIESYDSDLFEMTSKIDKKINEFYGTSGRKRNNSYIDLYGHRHKSRLDTNIGYCYVPSLTQKERGAWHLKIYFDENREIKYIIFIPLVYQEKLIPATEHVYQKIKKINLK